MIDSCIINEQFWFGNWDNNILDAVVVVVVVDDGYCCHGSEDADDDWNDRIEFEMQSMLCYSEYWFPTNRRSMIAMILWWDDHSYHHCGNIDHAINERNQ